MRYNAFFKFVAIVLAVAAVVAALGSAMAVVFCVGSGLYTNDPGGIRSQRLTQFASEYADFLAQSYAYRQSEMPAQVWQEEFWYHTGVSEVYWQEPDYVLVDEQTGEVVDTTAGDYPEQILVEVELWSGSVEKIGEDWQYYDYGEQTGQPLPSATEPTRSTEVTEEPSGMTTEPVTAPAATLPLETIPMDVGQTGMDENERWYEVISTSDGGLYRLYRDAEASCYSVLVCFDAEEVEEIAGSGAIGAMGEFLHEERYSAITVLVISLVTLLLMLLYLACAAGRKPGTEEVKPSGLNRLPLDLYTAADLLIGFGLVYLLIEGVAEELLDLNRLWNEYFWVLILAGASLCAGIGLICVLFWTALCAQVKAGSGFWWRNTLVGRFGSTVWKAFTGLLRKMLSLIAGVGGKVGENVPTVTDYLRDFNDKLPLMWQWLGMSMVMFALLAFFGYHARYGLGLFIYAIVVVMCIGMILYGARAFGQLRDAAKRMSQGDLDVKISTDNMAGCFKDFAGDLNALSDACIQAAREQMKSERMRTELITNVSHDIKTPLTSIINYVDLLQKAENEQQRREYLEVLERQSARLKKLIEDLMEMSKASSGNVAVELAPTDVAEAVNQALGEYADRFAALRLNVVLRKPEEQVLAMCDGKLLWRVMSNVMGNIVKYAMPGTRVYLDLTGNDRKVILAMKNISREELNVTADELMERFVRGDESRNTEGNGLGLNIAKSLMEVQGGSLELVVDGDLFKVVLTLPAAREQQEPA